jgi:hypothetical protein
MGMPDLAIDRYSPRHRMQFTARNKGSKCVVYDMAGIICQCLLATA